MKIQAMTKTEYAKGGARLSLSYSIGASPFGQYLVASTEKGITNLFFFDGGIKKGAATTQLKSVWPHASTEEHRTSVHEKISALLNDRTVGRDVKKNLKLHVKGTSFQIAVWKELMNISAGSLVSYAVIANKIGKPSAQRAVGTAIGANAIAVLIPCHRVIQSGGGIGGYRWGIARKMALIQAEYTKKK